MGANTLLVLPGTGRQRRRQFRHRQHDDPDAGDCDAIQRECPAVPAARRSCGARTQVVYGNHNWVPMTIYGTTPDFCTSATGPTGRGRAFTDQDVRNASKVCLIGPDPGARTLSGRIPGRQGNPRAKRAFKVVGVLSRKGANMMGMDQDDILLAPGRRSSTGSWAAARWPRRAADSLDHRRRGQHARAELYPASGSTKPSIPRSPRCSRPIPRCSVRFTNVEQILVGRVRPRM